jgi:hypothetical protein
MAPIGPRPGFLAIWSDVEAAAETDYLHWMTREHTLERLGIPGFLSMRMFRALGVPQRRYFILYELNEPAVVGSDAYLARLNEPTAWTQRAMMHVSNFVRGGGHVAAVAGTGQGGFLAALSLERSALADEARGLAVEAARHDRIASSCVLLTDHARTTIQTREKGLRTGDRSFDGLLLIEGLDAAAVGTAAESFVQNRPGLALDPRPSIHETIFARARDAG